MCLAYPIDRHILVAVGIKGNNGGKYERGRQDGGGGKERKHFEGLPQGGKKKVDRSKAYSRKNEGHPIERTGTQAHSLHAQKRANHFEDEGKRERWRNKIPCSMLHLDPRGGQPCPPQPRVVVVAAAASSSAVEASCAKGGLVIESDGHSWRRRPGVARNRGPPGNCPLARPKAEATKSRSG